MFEKLERRGALLAREQAEARRARTAERIAAALPGIAVISEGGTIEMAGRGLGRRYGRSATLRWTIKEACDER